LRPTEGTFASTTFETETVIIRRPRRAKGQRAGGAPTASTGGTQRGWRGLRRLDWRQPLWIKVRYRHGSQPFVVVECRGREWAYPWDTAILDIVRDVNNR